MGTYLSSSWRWLHEGLASAMLRQWLVRRKGLSAGKQISWAVRPAVHMLQAQSGRIKARKHSARPAGSYCWTCNTDKRQEHEWKWRGPKAGPGNKSTIRYPLYYVHWHISTNMRHNPLRLYFTINITTSLVKSFLQVSEKRKSSLKAKHVLFYTISCYCSHYSMRLIWHFKANFLLLYTFCHNMLSGPPPQHHGWFFNQTNDKCLFTTAVLIESDR
jgi:hypothetical protein